MWHSTIIKNIDWRHYLNDVLKLEGVELDHAESTVYSRIVDIYKMYITKRPKPTGNLASAVLSAARFPFAYIAPPLTEAINEVDWAITHQYVHPNEVTVVATKAGLILLKNASADFIKEFVENSPTKSSKMYEYVANEISVRNGEEDSFTVTPFDNSKNFVITRSSGYENKSARVYFDLTEGSGLTGITNAEEEGEIPAGSFDPGLIERVRNSETSIRRRANPWQPHILTASFTSSSGPAELVERPIDTPNADVIFDELRMGRPARTVIDGRNIHIIADITSYTQLFSRIFRAIPNALNPFIGANPNRIFGGLEFNNNTCGGYVVFSVNDTDLCFVPIRKIAYPIISSIFGGRTQQIRTGERKSWILVRNNSLQNFRDSVHTVFRHRLENFIQLEQIVAGAIGLDRAVCTPEIISTIQDDIDRRLSAGADTVQPISTPGLRVQLEPLHFADDRVADPAPEPENI